MFPEKMTLNPDNNYHLLDVVLFSCIPESLATMTFTEILSVRSQNVPY